MSRKMELYYYKPLMWYMKCYTIGLYITILTYVQYNTYSKKFKEPQPKSQQRKQK